MERRIIGREGGDCSGMYGGVDCGFLNRMRGQGNTVLTLFLSKVSREMQLLDLAVAVRTGCEIGCHYSITKQE